MVFKAGQSGNPAGRPKGTRHKLSSRFLDDMQEAWEANGKDVIKRVINDQPQVFLKIVASILPKEMHLKTGELHELTDDELNTALNKLRSITLPQIAASIGSRTEETQRH